MQTQFLIRTYYTLAWLLLLMGSNHSQVLCESTSYKQLQGRWHFLADDALSPHMTLSKDTIDICHNPTGWKEFTLTIDLGDSIAKADSLFAIELALGFRNDLVVIDGAWPAGTLCEFAAYAPPMGNSVDLGNGNGAYYFQCGDTKPLYGRSKAIVISGYYLAETLACADFLFAELYLGPKFNRSYPKLLIDTVSLCMKNVYNAANTITANMLEHDIDDTLQINRLDSIISIPFTTQVVNIKNLQSFDVEFELPAEDIENIEFIVAESSVAYCSEYTTSLTENGCKVTVFIDDSKINECFDDAGVTHEWFRLNLRRKKVAGSLNELSYKVTNINSLACSQNGLGGDLFVNCPALTDIAEDAFSEILVSDIGDMITVWSGGFIQEYELYNSLGSLVIGRKYDITNDLSSIEIDKTDFLRGVYLLRLTCRRADLTTYSSYLKLIIN